ETGRRNGQRGNHRGEPVRSRRQRCRASREVVRLARQTSGPPALSADEQSEKSGLAALFNACHGDNRAALIGYLPTGYPDVPTSIDAMKALTESGCDLIEVGVP